MAPFSGGLRMFRNTIKPQGWEPFQFPTKNSPLSSIVLFSFVDAKFADLLKGLVAEEVPGGRENLFSGIGALATSHNRIVVGAAFSVITKPICDWLNCMRKIRNHFSHEPRPASFDKDPVRSYVLAMPALEAPYVEAMRKKGSPTFSAAPRDLFFARSVMGFGLMVLELSTVPVARSMGLSPTVFRTVPFTDLPVSVREFWRACIDLTLDALIQEPPSA